MTQRMYCKEFKLSKDGGPNDFMPAVNEWLERWPEIKVLNVDTVGVDSYSFLCLGLRVWIIAESSVIAAIEADEKERILVKYR